MKYLNEIIKVLGMKTIIIISVSILVLILVILTYRLLKLKHYRNEIVDLENKMNAIDIGKEQVKAYEKGIAHAVVTIVYSISTRKGKRNC